MPFAIHVNKPTKRAIVHAPACPEVPADPVTHANNYWLRFPTYEETEVVRLTFVEKGYDAHWCMCAECQLTRDVELAVRASPDW